jgi:predicted ribosome quality control (RQC) complex YloA/Tae2 family protein
MHLLITGMDSITLKNYFSDDYADIEIPLNPLFTPQKNLNYFVKKYKKAVNGKIVISQNIATTNREIVELTNLIAEVRSTDDYHFLKSFQKTVQMRSDKSEKKNFRVIPISNEWEILIGRSNRENDLLTCKIAKPEDWWFHTRIFHGTHVVLRNFTKKKPPDELIILCANLAAYYSSAKNSTNVPVDYTQIRYVRKPRGSAPGYVIYTNQKTYYATPISAREARLDVRG